MHITKSLLICATFRKLLCQLAAENSTSKPSFRKPTLRNPRQYARSRKKQTAQFHSPETFSFPTSAYKNESAHVLLEQNEHVLYLGLARQEQARWHIEPLPWICWKQFGGNAPHRTLPAVFLKQLGSCSLGSRCGVIAARQNQRTGLPESSSRSRES